jgi:hypothetical protein
VTLTQENRDTLKRAYSQRNPISLRSHSKNSKDRGGSKTGRQEVVTKPQLAASLIAKAYKLNSSSSNHKLDTTKSIMNKTTIKCTKLKSEVSKPAKQHSSVHKGEISRKR